MIFRECKKTVTAVYKDKRGREKKELLLLEKHWKNIVPFLKKLRDDNDIPSEVFITYHVEMPDYMHIVISSPDIFDNLIESAEKLAKDNE